MKLPYPRWLLLPALLAPALPAFAADPLDEVDQSARQWVQLRVETARLDAAWHSEHELVESTIAALKERATLAEEKRDLTKARTAHEREEIETLRAKKRAATEDLKTFEVRLKTLSDRLVALRPSLPPRLSEALEMSYRSLANPSLPPAEHMQLAVNVLNRCAQFDRLITTGEDVLVLEGEPAPKSLETIYWGLSQGYALDRATRRAWLGSPAAGGWRWEARPDAFAGVAQLLAVARDKSDPALVAVPAAATKSLPETARNATP